MAQMLYGIRAVTSANVSFAWVDADFLWANGVKPWSDMPVWWPPRNDYAEPTFGGITGGVGALNLDGGHARGNGLTHRPLAATAGDTLRWYHATFDDWPEDRRPGLSAAREAEVLAAWNASRR